MRTEHLAPYISHLGYEFSMATEKYQLFGVTQSHNWDTEEWFRQAHVFRLQLDIYDVLNVPDQNYKIRQLSGPDLGYDSRFLGMRPQMEFDGSKFIVHCIYGNLSSGTVTYLKVSPDSGQGSAYQFSNGSSEVGIYLGMEAAWVGSN